MSHFSKTAVALALAAGLVASAHAQTNLTAETANNDGVPGNTILHLADVLSERNVANLQVASGQTLTNSIRNVAEGKSDVSAAPLILPFLLSRGVGPYAKLGKEKGAELAGNLRALYPYNVGGYNAFFYSNKGYQSWEDLRGKTIWNGPPRGAALTNARQALQIAAGLEDGKDYKGVQQNWNQLDTTLVDGSVDAFVFPATWLHPRIVTMTSAGKVTVLSIPKDKFESDLAKKIIGVPGNIPIVLDRADIPFPEEQLTLVSEDGKLRALGSAFAEVVNKSMSNELAKAITKAHIETLDKLKARSKIMANVGLAEMDPVKSSFCGASPLKYHPGAVQAWAEAGIKVPDCAQAK
ncbi:MAG: TAXI family TRAP transporter solute-binding subunit [Burkholderiaceae bacterium]